MAERVAFLIGNQTFRPDSGLQPLQGPANDLAALARVLRDSERGRFDVHEFLDKPSHDILLDIEQALGSAALGDLVLIYYSGHGKLDRNGRLCLATGNTRQDGLLATSIPARQLRDLVEESDCDQVVLLLDCCYSGAVEDGLRGDIGSELRVVDDARGFYIMTASTGVQVARETERVPGGDVMGRFTAALVNGLESGAADLDRKGKILLSDLRRYLGQVVRGQTPQFFDRKASGDPLISFNPATPAMLLDAGVLADLNAEQWHRRKGAVSALAGVLQDGVTEEARAAAKAALQHRLGQERDYSVRAELESALGLKTINAADVPPPASPRLKTNTLPGAEVAIDIQPGQESNLTNTTINITGRRQKNIGLMNFLELEEAITAYRAALQESTRERVPLDWANRQNSLGTALQTLGQCESGTARLEEAVAAYRDALQELTRERMPLDWATTQNSLGNALRALGQREGGTARLEEAVAAYRNALQELTRERVPLDWATTQNNLGTALQTLGQCESGTARLEEAVAAYRAALQELTPERVPLEWAATQNDLGNALQALGQRESGTARLEEAVAAYRDALQELTRERAPFDWAATQNNLGTALQTLGQRESGTARLEEAVAAYRAALQELTRERVPLDWATTQNNLGNAQTLLNERLGVSVHKS